MTADRFHAAVEAIRARRTNNQRDDIRDLLLCAGDLAREKAFQVAIEAIVVVSVDDLRLTLVTATNDYPAARRVMCAFLRRLADDLERMG